MFNESKYTKWYRNICSKTYEGVTEIHHIIPKCLGGTDEPKNLVKLSPKAHFICHWLLTKMVNDTPSRQKMYYAFNFMLRKPKDLKEKRYYPCSRVYQIAKTLLRENNPNDHLDTRLKISEARKRAWKNPTPAMIEGIEKMRKSKIGKPSPHKGKPGIKPSEETKQLLIKQRTGRKWYTDGENCYFIRPENAKPNYRLGRK